MKIYCFGNEFVKEDSFAKTVSSELKVSGIETIKVNSVLEFIENPPTPFIILDVVEGIREPRVLSIDELSAQPHNAHDLDLGFYLKLLKETGKLKEVKIIGIPQKGDKLKIRKEIQKIIYKFSE